MKNINTRVSLLGATIFLVGGGSALAVLQQSQQNQQSDQQQGQQGQTDQQKKKQDRNNPQNNQANPPPANNDNSKPAPLFGGTVGIKSSRQTKDSASLGFNGVDPNGQVAKSFLTASPTSADAAKAQAVASYRADPVELAKFIQDGNLNSNAAPQKAEK